MWLLKKFRAHNTSEISKGEFVAIVIAAIALTFSIGVARWTWLILDEQITLRTDVEELRHQQTQVETQYEIWLEALQKEGQALRDERNALPDVE